VTLRSSMFNRMLGDVVGCVVLAFFIASLIFSFPRLGTLSQRLHLFSGIYVALAIAAVFWWHRSGANRRQWLAGIQFSVVAGLAWFLIDVAIAYFNDPSVPLLDALISGHSFFITLLLCPGYTAMTFSGWIRSFVICDTVPISQTSDS
jgi:hypothetical protein